MDWEDVKRLFHEAVRDRRALEGAPGDVRAEVEALLRAHDAAPLEPPREGPGKVIGRYKLLQQIGEGGFGIVYMAEQTEPVRRKVALKVLKAGMDTGQVVARFEAERQALALMDHDNIAKVLDAGATPSGRPYFVMELVKGVPITEYCDEARVDTRGRLGLFVQVCAAVQHAHQKGIIHRDLKPSNVLVTLHDGEPVPKVIDFGIAKAIDRRLTDKTLFTEFRQMVGTPDYMAPEQAELSGLDVDTRADVYSLGVLLYELLTGTKPFDLGRKAYDEIVRTIRESEPQRPSTRVSTMGDALLAVAQKRQTPPAILGNLLRGDLDWIVLKALEKDRSRRYETANGLALDVGRYLADEPVLAMPASVGLRLRKYVRRHRAGVGAAVVVVFAVLLSGGGAYAGMRRARTDAANARRAAAACRERRDQAIAARGREAEQRTRAEAGAVEAAKETMRSEVILGFVNEMLSSADPHEARGRDYTLRQLLDDFDRGLGDRLRDQPQAEAILRNTIGTAYVGLGLPDRAARHLHVALDLRRNGAGEDSPEHRESLSAVGWLRHEEADYRGAEQVFRQILDAERRVGSRAGVARAAASLADMLTHLAQYAQARDLCEEALAIQRAEFGEDHAEVETTLQTLASIDLARGDPRGAEQHARAALAIGRKIRGDRHPSVAYAIGRIARARQAVGDYAEAERLYREALAISVAAFGNAHPVTALAMGNLASVLCDAGDLDGAERTYRDAIARLRAFGDHAYLPACLAGLASVLQHKRDLAGAEAAARDGLAIERRVYGDDHPKVAHALGNLAVALGANGDLDQAERLHRESLAVLRRTLGEKHAGVGYGLHGLAMVLYEKHDYAQAEPLLREALAILRAALGDGHPDIAMVLSNLGALLRATGAPEETERVGREAIAILRAAFGDEHFKVALARADFAALLAETGRDEEAIRCLREALPVLERQFGADHEHTMFAVRQLAGTLKAGPRYDELEPLLCRLLEFQRRTLGADHLDVARTLTDLGCCRGMAGDASGAEQVLREAVAIVRKAPDADPRLTGQCLYNLGLALLGRADLAAAERALREALAIRRAHPPAGELDLASNLFQLGCVLRDTAPAEAKLLLGEAAPILRKIPSQRPVLVLCLYGIGRCEAAAGRFREAGVHFVEAVEVAREEPARRDQVETLLRNLIWARFESADLDLAERSARELLSIRADDSYALGKLAGIQLIREDFAGAERLALAVFERERKARGDADPETAGYLSVVAVIATRGGDPARAEALCREGLAACRSDRLLVALGEALIAQGKHADAEPPLREALAIRERSPEDWSRWQAASMVGESLLGQERFAEAEPLLVEAAERMNPSPVNASRKRRAIERVVELYERWGKPESAAPWRKRLK